MKYGKDGAVIMEQVKTKKMLTLRNIVFYNEQIIDDALIVPAVLFCYYMEQYTGLYTSAFMWLLNWWPF
jgi:hypothetical protein